MTAGLISVGFRLSSLHPLPTGCYEGMERREVKSDSGLNPGEEAVREMRASLFHWRRVVMNNVKGEISCALRKRILQRAKKIVKKWMKFGGWRREGKSDSGPDSGTGGEQGRCERCGGPWGVHATAPGGRPMGPPRRRRGITSLEGRGGPKALKFSWVRWGGGRLFITHDVAERVFKGCGLFSVYTPTLLNKIKFGTLENDRK